MRVLITGGAGFIGSNLADYLLDNNCEVIIIDDLSTGKKENIAHLKNKIKFVEADISTYKLFTLGDLDGVVHLAAQPSVPLSIENFKTSSSLNSLGSINVIDFCKGREIPFVYASSSAIYGNLPIGDDESNDIDFILSEYRNSDADTLITVSSTQMQTFSENAPINSNTFQGSELGKIRSNRFNLKRL